jgi:hypothetical protein
VKPQSAQNLSLKKRIKSPKMLKIDARDIEKSWIKIKSFVKNKLFFCKIISEAFE